MVGEHIGRATGAAVFDIDNIEHGGIRRRAGGKPFYFPRGHLANERIVDSLRARGVTCGTVCRNWDWSADETLSWNRLGYRTVATHENADAAVQAELLAYTRQGFKNIFLISGDGDFARVVEFLVAIGVEVSCWARESKTAPQLRAAASHYRAIDRFVDFPGKQARNAHGSCQPMEALS